jgi:guanine nucleotide-binding protein subunit alpha
MQILKPSTWLRFRAITERADNRQTQRSLENDSHIEHRRKSTQDPVHVVVVGNRGSGKSTLIKQVRIISSVGFTSSERYQAREAICKDFLDAFKEALNIMKINRVEFKNEKAKIAVDLICQTDDHHCSKTCLLDWKVCNAMETVWKDGSFRELLFMKTHPCHHTLLCFRQYLDFMCELRWVPCNQDVLRARYRPSRATTATPWSLNLQMMDLSGIWQQRLIHCFERSPYLLFMVALSEYDRYHTQNPQINYLREAMAHFDSLINAESFRNKPIILFLNKYDKFASKLAASPVSEHFADYTGLGTDLEAVTTFFTEHFRQLNRTEKRQVYVHRTNATNEKSVRLGIAHVIDDIFMESVRSV